jgi:RimJ/RimL family protein N-acetyltransferase
VRAIYRAPFVNLNCRRVCSFVPEENARAIDVLARLGFALEGEHPDMLPTGTALSFGLLRSDRRVQRWITLPASPLGPPDLGAPATR